jgi:hypothetical protein
LQRKDKQKKTKFKENIFSKCNIYYLVVPQILLNSIKLVDLDEDIRFKSTVFLSKLLKTWHFFGAKNGLILSAYFYEAKCGNLSGS